MSEMICPCCGQYFEVSIDVSEVYEKGKADAIPEGMMLVKKDDFTEDLLNQGYTKGRAAAIDEMMSCNGCKHYGKWDDEIYYGYASPCTICKRKCKDNYEQ